MINVEYYSIGLFFVDSSNIFASRVISDDYKCSISLQLLLLFNEFLFICSGIAGARLFFTLMRKKECLVEEGPLL
jgi:hypothetical protein